MRNHLSKYAVLLVVLFAAACAEPRLGKSLVIVLPDADGTVGAVTFDDGKNKVVLDTALAAAKVSASGTVESVAVTQKDVDDIFAVTLNALPTVPRRFRLFFKGDSTVLTTESEAAFEAVFGDIANRKAYEVEVTGHTDTLGDTKYNEDLSFKRASAIRQRLVDRGIDPNLIFVYGRGEWDLLVKTGDEKFKPRNRRVEILVR